jgi:hypothetical protein
VKIRTKRLLQAIGKIVGMCAALLFTGLLCALMVRAGVNYDRYWEEHAAERHLGSGAQCADPDDRIVSCIKNGQAYQCIVEDSEHVACSKVDRLP